MSAGMLTKVMKYTLRYIDGCGEFHEMQKVFWELQRKTREVLNRSLQMAFDWDYQRREYFRKNGEYPDEKTLLGDKLINLIYNRMAEDYPDFARGNLAALTQIAWKKYQDCRSDVLKGNMSLPSYKKDHPIVFRADSVKVSDDKYGTPVVELTTLSRNYKKAHGINTNPVFEVLLNDGTQRAIFDRVLSGEYKLGQCMVQYEKRKWFLLLNYSFPAEKLMLDKEKILGVDLGESIAVCASSVSEWGRFVIDGGEVTKFAAQIEARKRSQQHQAAYCGDGRIGHGTKTRVAAVYKTEDKIANFRDTVNHRYSKALIDYAVKHGFGTIQMEDLSGIKPDTGFPKLLRHWTYYDLQSKIEAKAKESGIQVVKVDPRFTSQRCSKCGCIDEDNRKDQAHFCCVSCGFKANADFNASQNLSVKNIDKIIEKEYNANRKQT